MQKKWYYRKRLWLVGVILLVYFCFVPSQFTPTYENTGLLAPVLKDGRVDYFSVYENTYIQQLRQPEHNGMRDILAAFGPTALEQMGTVESVPWEDFPTNEHSKQWFDTYWKPLCEQMSIDPYKKPFYYEKRGFYGTVLQWKKEQKAAAKQSAENDLLTENQTENYTETVVAIEDDDPSGQKLWQKLVDSPWKGEESPEVAQWLADYSPVLDLFGRAVRKPYYASWKRQDGSMIGILLPDVQAQRDFSRSMRVRITERQGRGDIEGAWYDIMSLFHLARHYKKDQILVVNLVGIAMQGEGIKAARRLLLEPSIDDTMLQKFSEDLKTLPQDSFVLNSEFEDTLIPFGVLQALAMGDFTEDIFLPRNDGFRGVIDSVCNRLPIDRNIAGRHLNLLLQKVRTAGWPNVSTSSLSKTRDNEVDHIFQSIRQRRESWWSMLSLPLIRSRSKVVAERIFSECLPATASVQTAFDRSISQHAMLQLAIALGRYKNKYGDYPETLDSLVPEFLDMYLVDPFTGTAGFVYRRESGELSTGVKTPVRLYSVGQDGVDDSGNVAEIDPVTGRIGHEKDDIFW